MEADRITAGGTYRVIVAPFERAKVCLVGCGGTGSFIAPAVARLAHVLRENGIALEGWLIDPDVVTGMNIGRQNFCAADVGKPKAQVLCDRYNLAFGWDSRYTVARYAQAAGERHGGHGRQPEIELIVGAVDSVSARREIARHIPGSYGATWSIWLDCGNEHSSGQVLLGMRRNTWGRKDNPVLDAMGLCHGLPLPSEQHPELVRPGGGSRARPISCAEHLGAGEQGLFVNQTIAAIAAAYLEDILIKREVRKFATYVDLETGSMRSLKITASNLVPYIGREGQTDDREEAA